MGGETIQAIVGIVTAIIGLAILSVLVSKNANTSAVIGAASGGLAQDISAATSPVTGSGGYSANMFTTGNIGNLGSSSIIA